jgi:hypothetical protein
MLRSDSLDVKGQWICHALVAHVAETARRPPPRVSSILLFLVAPDHQLGNLKDRPNSRGFGVGANVEAGLRTDYFPLSHQNPQKIIGRDPLRIGAIEIASTVSIGGTSAWVRVSGLCPGA